MASRHIETEIEIDAPADRIWELLIDFSRMPSWNPFIRSIAGELKVGASLSIQVSPPGKPAMRFSPTIVAVRPERELRWLGRFLMRGLFDGEHYFLLEPLNERRTRFIQGEKFSGLLVGPLSGIFPATLLGFQEMNAALKKLAEQRRA